jgi:hypothetical protein
MKPDPVAPGERILSVRTEFIGYPNRVKKILLDHCRDLGRNAYIQGKGMPNLVKKLLNT